MADQILVSFQGDGAGVAALSWGQRELWDAMRQKHTWMPIGAVAPLAPGTTVEDVVADLRFLMGRYPTLRTRLRLDPDGPKQVVADSGEVPLEIVDADHHADPAEVAEQVRRRYWDTGYDFVTQWPIRMAVIRHRGLPAHRVWVMCHLVTDATGAGIMLRELADRDTIGTGDGRTAAMPPLEQARWQGSPAGQRQCEAVLRHWERILRTISPRRFPEPGDRTGPRYWNGTFTSAAIPLAVGVVSARTGVESSAVLLATFAVAMARVTGINPVVTRVVVNNRFRPGLASTVSPIVNNGLCELDVAGLTLDEAVAHTRRKAMSAYKYAYYDPARLAELVARVNQERGEPIDIGCFFNDRRPRRPDTGRTDADGSTPTPEQIQAALPASTFRWDEKQDDQPYDPLFLTLDETPDTVAMSLFIDAHRISAADAEAGVRGMEQILVAGSLGHAVVSRA